MPRAFKLIPDRSPNLCTIWKTQMMPCHLQLLLGPSGSYQISSGRIPNEDLKLREGYSPLVSYAAFINKGPPQNGLPAIMILILGTSKKGP